MTESAVLRATRLGEAVNGHPERVAAALPELVDLMAEAVAEGATALLLEVIRALGCAWDERATVLLLQLAQAGHVDPDVRLALAQSLPHADDGILRGSVIDALIDMTIDVVSEVRDWACFGLNQLEADSASARAAFAALLADPDPDTACDALVGLARLGDPRALQAALERLSGDADVVRLLELTAAELLGDP